MSFSTQLTLKFGQFLSAYHGSHENARLRSAAGRVQHSLLQLLPLDPVKPHRPFPASDWAWWGYPRRSTRVKRGTPLTRDFGWRKSLRPGWNFLRTALPPETLPTQSCFLPVLKPEASSAFSPLSITGISLNNSLTHFIPSWHLLLRECKLAHRSQICF